MYAIRSYYAGVPVDAHPLALGADQEVQVAVSVVVPEQRQAPPPDVDVQEP